MSLSILYLGDSADGTTSRQRAEALRRLGHRVTIVSQHEFFPSLGRIANKLDYWTGHRLRQPQVARKLKSLIPSSAYDVAWVDAGWWCGAPVAKLLKTVAKRVVLLNLDDPTGPREPHHWKSLLGALPWFDLCAVVRWETAHEFQQLGAPRVARIWRSYDEVAHAPERAAEVPPDKFHSEVCFIGTHMEDRHELMVRLVEGGVPLSIWGNQWENCPGWKTLKNSYRGPGLTGADYVAAIGRSKLCLGLLSSLNRDLHTTRSSEVPFAGGLLCAKRTTEHEAMYEHGEEAIFWQDAEECLEQCRELLANPERRRQIQQAGAAKVRRLGVGHETVCHSLLDKLNWQHEEPHASAIIDLGLPLRQPLAAIAP